MSTDNINKELVSEIKLLRTRLKEYESNTNSTQLDVQTLSDFRVIEELDNKLKISGILLAEGVWNGVLYTKEELKKMYNKFKDKLSSRHDDRGSTGCGDG